MNRGKLNVGGVVCLLLLAVLAASGGPPAVAGKKKKNKSPKAAMMKLYDPAPTPGDKWIYWVTLRVWGIENVTGSAYAEGFDSLQVSGPFTRGDLTDVYKLYSGGFYQEFFIVKKGLARTLESRDDISLWVYDKPVRFKKKMRFGRTCTRKIVGRFTDLEGEVDDAAVVMEEALTAAIGGPWTGEHLSFDDTITIHNEYYQRSDDRTLIWHGEQVDRFARGVGLVEKVDEWVFEDRIYGLFGTYKIGYERTWELAYARVGGVEYGDPDVDD